MLCGAEVTWLRSRGAVGELGVSAAGGAAASAGGVGNVCVYYIHMELKAEERGQFSNVLDSSKVWEFSCRRADLESRLCWTARLPRAMRSVGEALVRNVGPGCVLLLLLLGGLVTRRRSNGRSPSPVRT